MFSVLLDDHGKEDVSKTNQHRLSLEKSVKGRIENLYQHLGKTGGLTLLLFTLSVVDVSEGAHTCH